MRKRSSIDPRTEVVSVRVTKAERERLDALGGPTAVLARALVPPRPAKLRYRVERARPYLGHLRVVWFDGTVGQTWPKPATGGNLS